MKALVTGATGFVGSNLARRLIRDGWQVDVVVRSGSNLSTLANIEKFVDFKEHDGSIERLVEIFHGSNPDIVFHLAAKVLPEHSAKDIEHLIQSNILFGTQLVEAMALSKVRYLVNTGTMWQHFDNEKYNPVSLYAATKQAYEVILRYYVQTRGISVINLKLADTYGAGDARSKLINSLLEIAANGKSLDMTHGQQYMDLVYVDDVVNAFLVAAKRLLSELVEGEEDYVVASGRAVTLRNLVQIVETVIGQPLQIQWGRRPYRVREVMQPWKVGVRLKGWSPKVSLESGLHQVWLNHQACKVLGRQEI